MQEVQNSLKNILLEPADAKRLAIFAGELNGNIKLIEKNFKVKIFHNGNKLNIKGADDNAQRASSALLDLYKQTQKNNEISNETIHLCIQEHMNQPTKKTTKLKEVKSSYQIHTPKKVITARGANQEQYLKNIESNELNFGIGPAGTGKTYLAVAAGVHALLNDRFRRSF
jgi:phosphate starvation-inducible PhoH-like protein